MNNILQTIIEFIFNLIVMLFNFLLSPLISVITALFPTLTTLINYATNYITTGVRYASLILELFMIPRGAIILLFDYYLIIFAIWLITIVIKFAITIYNKFKP